MRTKHLIPRNADAISGLPDAVLGRIVSFLPPAEAVATSILSRRWQFVWASSPSLDFDFSQFSRSRGRKKAFTEFVDRALDFFAGAELRRFRLSLEGYDGPEPRLDEWIGSAASRDVQELDLCIPRWKHVKFPGCIFGCESLTALRLRTWEYAFELPAPVGLRRLKRLHLAGVSLSEGRFLGVIFSTCVLLEDLLLKECKIDGVLDIHGPMIKSLTISNCEWIRPIELKVSAPCLQCFTYVGEAADDHSLENLASMVEVSLNLTAPSVSYKTDEQWRLWLIKILRMLGNARVLMLSRWCIEQLSRAPNLSECLKIQGENLKQLMLQFERKEDSVAVVTPLLSSCPNVEILEVCIRPSQRSRACDKRQQRESRMKGILKNLKTVKLKYIDESKTGIRLVKFLLENVRSLENMTIITSNDGLEQAEFMSKVSLFKHASPNLVIKYQVDP